jgi:hypothetical protein
VRSIHPLIRPGRALAGFAVAVSLGLAGAAAIGVTPASASPLTVSLTANGENISNPEFWTTEAVHLTATASAPIGSDTIKIVDLSTNTVAMSCPAGQTTCLVPTISFATPTTQFYEAFVMNGSQVAAEGVLSVPWQAFPVTLSASPSTLPIGGTTTLTASVPRDVGPTNWWIEIFDSTTGTEVGVPCGIGKSCTATVSETVATTHQFVAYVSDKDPNQPPTHIQSQSAVSFATWSDDGWQVSLSAPPFSVGGETVTATANMDVGPTRFYIMIFDETTGQPVGTPCPSGTSCSRSFTPSPRGDDLVAFIAPLPDTYPPSGIEASSNVVHTFETQPG